MTTPTPDRFSKQQPQPVKGTGPLIYLRVRDDMAANGASIELCALIRARAEVGADKYGVRLQAHNGRDAGRDAIEEAADLCQYLRQCVEEGQDVGHLYRLSLWMLGEIWRSV